MITRLAKKSILLGAVLFLLSYSVSGIAAAKTKITMWTLGTTYTMMLKSLMPEFEKAFPDVDLELITSMGAADKLTVAFAGGAAPDIVTQSTRNAPQWITKGLFRPVDLSAVGVRTEREFQDLFFPGARGTIFLYGKPYFA